MSLQTEYAKLEQHKETAFHWGRFNAAYRVGGMTNLKAIEQTLRKFQESSGSTNETEHLIPLVVFAQYWHALYCEVDWESVVKELTPRTIEAPLVEVPAVELPTPQRRRKK